MIVSRANYRPYGQYGNPPLNFHAYTTSQSVYWNTIGLKKHPRYDYLITSRQYGNGYVIGTFGAFTKVVTTPVEGVASYGGVDLNYNSAPEDWVEGEAKGDLLVPQSLYMDQLAKRKLRENIK